MTIETRTLATVLLIATGLLQGCSSTSNVRSEYDKNVDFGDYRTFNFYSDAGPDKTQYQSLFSQYMVAAITREMEARGYTMSNSPDLLVNFNAILQEKTQVRTTPSMNTGYYGYRRGYYDPWAGYGMGYNTTETRVTQYTEGTFNIDLVDARRKRLVWEAVGKGKVTDRDFDDLRNVVDEGVQRYFSYYPFVAGESLPRN